MAEYEAPGADEPPADEKVPEVELEEEEDDGEPESGSAKEPPALSTAAGPSGSGTYVVRQGDCIESIAFEHGHFWQTLWDHPGNKELRRVRGSANALLPGDRVEVPPVRVRTVKAATGEHHRFKLKAVPATLKLQLVDDAGPRADIAYALIVDGVRIEGVTDADGRIEAKLMPNARNAKLEIPDDEATYEVALRHLDPIEEPSGFRARLENLGFGAGSAGEDLGPEDVEGIRRFQLAHELEVTGEPDQATRDKLSELYGA